MKDITFIIHTFKRPDSLQLLMDSIDKFYPDVETLVYDDSEHDNGLSYGRNLLVGMVDTKFFLLLDDDFVFFENTKIEKLKTLILKGYDIVGGSLVNNGVKSHYEGTYDLSEGVLSYIPSTEEPLDFVYNFFLGRTETFRKYKWDEDLKLAEHSIRGDQCVTIRRKGKDMDIIPIEDLVFPSIKFVESTRVKYEKNAVEIWTEVGWRKIKAVSVHKCKEKMCTVRALNGLIECTEHHSLVIDGQEKKPDEIGVGGRIELYSTPQLNNTLKVNSEYAWAMGFFLAEGCVSYTKNRATISITNQNIDELNRFRSALEQFGVTFTLVKETKRRDNCRFLHINHTRFWCKLFDEFYTQKRLKKIPAFVFDWDKESRQAFFNGFIDGDGDHRSDGIMSYSQKSSACAQGIIQLVQDIYLHHTIGKNSNKFGEWYKIYLYKEKGRTFEKGRDIVTKIDKYDYDNYVYDIEIDDEKHSFLAGVGNVNVHNTAFFLTNKGKLKIGYVEEVEIDHRQVKTPEYLKYRNRAWYFMDIFMKKYGLKKIITFGGGITYNLGDYKQMLKDEK